MRHYHHVPLALTPVSSPDEHAQGRGQDRLYQAQPSPYVTVGMGSTFMQRKVDVLAGDFSLDAAGSRVETDGDGVVSTIHASVADGYGRGLTEPVNQALAAASQGFVEAMPGMMRPGDDAGALHQAMAALAEGQKKDGDVGRHAAGQTSMAHVSLRREGDRWVADCVNVGDGMLLVVGADGGLKRALEPRQYARELPGGRVVVAPVGPFDWVGGAAPKPWHGTETLDRVSLRVEAGDRVVLMTDGIWKALPGVATEVREAEGGYAIHHHRATRAPARCDVEGLMELAWQQQVAKAREIRERMPDVTKAVVAFVEAGRSVASRGSRMSVEAVTTYLRRQGSADGVPGNCNLDTLWLILSRAFSDAGVSQPSFVTVAAFKAFLEGQGGHDQVVGMLAALPQDDYAALYVSDWLDPRLGDDATVAVLEVPDYKRELARAWVLASSAQRPSLARRIRGAMGRDEFNDHLRALRQERSLGAHLLPRNEWGTAVPSIVKPLPVPGLKPLWYLSMLYPPLALVVAYQVMVRRPECRTWGNAVRVFFASLLPLVGAWLLRSMVQETHDVRDPWWGRVDVAVPVPALSFTAVGQGGAVAAAPQSTSGGPAVSLGPPGPGE